MYVGWSWTYVKYNVSPQRLAQVMILGRGDGNDPIACSMG